MEGAETGTLPPHGTAGSERIRTPASPAPNAPHATGGACPGALLPLAEAAWAAGLARSELRACIDRGEIAVHRLLLGRRAVAAVDLKDMERLVRDLDAQRPAPDARLTDGELATLRETVARLEGELTASDRVERALQRYADKLETRLALRERELEARLAESRKRELTLARALGQAEERLERYKALEPPKPRRRGLFGRR